MRGDGRQPQTLDSQAQDDLGPGHHSRQDHCVGGQSDLCPQVDEGKKGMENALRTKPLEVKEQ